MPLPHPTLSRPDTKNDTLSTPSGPRVCEILNPYKFIGFGAIEVTKPYKFIRFGAMEVTKPYNFIGFGAVACGHPDRSGPPTSACRSGEQSVDPSY